MRSRWLLNLGLLALVMLLVVVVLYEDGADNAQPNAPLTTLDTEKINSIRIQKENNDQLRLERNKDGWFLVAPLRARADRLRVQSLLRLAIASSELRRPATSDNIGKYGLDKPKARVWFDNEEIQLGTHHPFKKARYVLYNGELHLVRALDFDPASQRHTDLISHRLFAEGRRPVTFELPELTLRRTDGKWQMRPANDDITPDRINQLADEWRFARALAVERYGGQDVRGWIRVTLKDVSGGEKNDQQLVELGILSDDPGFVLYRKDEGLTYRFTEHTGKRLMNIKSE
ncbi:MAG: DUF4340 domain-containing protein [Acidiferrobacterales bacterium]